MYYLTFIDLLQLCSIVYVVLSVVHLLTQFILAHLNHVHQNDLKSGDINYVKNLIVSESLPSVSIVYPIYNESIVVLNKVLEAAKIVTLEIPSIEIIFIDDGSTNINQTREIYKKYENDSIKVKYLNNKGKREAQYIGFNMAKSKFIITVDSDTIINTDGIIRLLAPMLKDDKVGAVTGDIKVENKNRNFLTRLISLRYWTAFNLERAAQSYSGTMLCCSGPFTVYRKSVIDMVKNDYINQKFLGNKCTYGDDRHLTNLVIGKGYKTLFQEGAEAKTYVPENIRTYILQQTRWNKSFYREIIWSLKYINKISLYSIWDMIIQPILFVNFLIVLGIQLFILLQTADLKVLLYFISIIVIMASLRSLYGLIRTFDYEFLLFIFYGFIHVLILIPIRFKALLTLKDNNWGTRSTKKKFVYLDFLIWLLFFFGFELLISSLIF